MSISTLSSQPSPTHDDGSVSSSHPRADGPRRRRFTPEQKLAHLAAYEEACEQQQGGAYLRREGLYSSLITEWRRLRDADVLQGKQPGQAVGRPSKEQAEIARLRRERDQTRSPRHTCSRKICRGRGLDVKKRSEFMAKERRSTVEVASTV